MLAVPNGAIDPKLVYQLEDLKKQREAFQQAKNDKAEAVVLANIATLHLVCSDLRGALEAALAAQAISAKTKDTEGELTQLIIAGHAHVALGEADQALQLARHGRVLCEKARETKFAGPARGAVTILDAAAGAMQGFSGGQDLAPSAALLALVCLEVAKGNVDIALPAGKQVLDIFEAAGENGAAAVASLALANAHVQAGQAEDGARRKVLLPMAHGHASAAAYHAGRAKRWFSALGAQSGAAAAQAILELERIQSCSNMISKGAQFSYDNWNTLNP